MITVSQDYTDYLSNKAFSPYSKIIVDGVSYLGNVIKTFPKIKHQATTITGSFPAKTVDFEIYDYNNNLDFQDKEIEVYKGYLIDDQVEYVQQGVFIPRAENITRNISTKVIKFQNVQDRTQLLDNAYESSLDYSEGQTHTGLEIVQEICTRRGITLLNNNFAFYNYNFPQPNYKENITDREVISRLAEIGGETAFFNYEGELTIKGQTATNVTIPRSRYEKISEEKTITFNTVVLGKEGIDDDIVYPTEMQESNRVAYKILDNPFVDLIRGEIIEEVASHIIGLTYMPYQLSGFIDGYIFELNDVISILDRNSNTVRAVILDYESTSRYKSTIKLNIELETQKTNYNLAGSNKQSIDIVKLEVDHINGEITSLVSKTNDIDTTVNNNYQEITQKFDGYTPTSRTVEIENSVRTLQTDTYTKTEINTKLIDGSVQKVQTVSMSGTFDENGMTYDKQDGEGNSLGPTKTTINELGVGTRKAGSSANSDEYILFAGYVDGNNTQFKDNYLGQTLVAAENMQVEKYFVMPDAHSRIEKYENGGGMFYV